MAALHDSGDLDWHYQRPLSATAVNGAKLTIYNEEELDYNFYLHGSLAFEHKRGDGLIVAGGPNPDDETYTVTFKPGPGTWRALAVQAQQDEGLPAVRLARGADRFVLSEVEAEMGGRKLPFVLATTTGFGEVPQQGAMAAIDGDPRTGWGVSSGEHRSPMLALRFASPLVTGPELGNHRATAPGIELPPRHHRPLPAGAVGRRVLLPRHRRLGRATGRPARATPRPSR